MIVFRGNKYNPLELFLTKKKLLYPLTTHKVIPATVNNPIDTTTTNRVTHLFYVHVNEEKIEVTPTEYEDIIKQHEG